MCTKADKGLVDVLVIEVVLLASDGVEGVADVLEGVDDDDESLEETRV